MKVSRKEGSIWGLEKDRLTPWRKPIVGKIWKRPRLRAGAVHIWTPEEVARENERRGYGTT